MGVVVCANHQPWFPFVLFLKGGMGANQYIPDPITGSEEFIDAKKFIEPSQMSQQPEEDILSNDGSEALKNFRALSEKHNK